MMKRRWMWWWWWPGWWMNLSLLVFLCLCLCVSEHVWIRRQFLDALDFTLVSPWLAGSAEFRIWNKGAFYHVIMSLCHLVIWTTFQHVINNVSPQKLSDHQDCWRHQMAPWKFDTLCPNRSLFRNLGPLSEADQQMGLPSVMSTGHCPLASGLVNLTRLP